MKSICKIFLLALGVYTSAFSQIPDIARFPFQDKEKESRESIPIVISENEILIIYYKGSPSTTDYWGRTIDTLYYSKSTNGGRSWNEPVCILELGIHGYLDRDWELTSLRTSTGRIITAWPNQSHNSINIIYTNDNGLSWSDTTRIASTSTFNCTLSEINSGKIFLSYTNNYGRQVRYRESTDNGET